MVVPEEKALTAIQLLIESAGVRTVERVTSYIATQFSGC
jgi:hypothetical protein